MLVFGSLTIVEASQTTDLKAKVEAWQRVSKEKDQIILDIQTDLATATTKIGDLTDQSATIQKGLDNWRLWGTEESRQKTVYYNSAKEFEGKYNTEALKRAKLEEKYYRLKILGSLLAGLAAMMIYLKTGAQTSVSGMLTGLIESFAPAGIIVKILSPILVFIGGFLLIFLVF